MIKTKIIYDRKKEAKRNGDGTLEIRITVARRAYYISTGIRVRDSEWKAGIIVNRPDASQMNKRLATLYEKVCEAANRHIKDEKPVDMVAIRNDVWKCQEAMSDDPLFLNWVNKQIPMLNISPGTRKQYKTLQTRLTEFEKMRRWQDVTAENISAFDTWLHQRKKKDGHAIIDSAVYKYHRSLKALLNRAVTFGKIDRNPYDRLRGKIKRGDKENVEYLTEGEMKSIQSLELTADELIKARDIFVFQMYTGMSYSDAQAFDITQYRKDGNSWRHVGERIKTGVAYVSSLLPPAVDAIEKYGMKVPQMENHIYNRALKTIGALAKIGIPLHSHLARHTFATYMLRNGAKIENVSRMLGHTNIRQTQRYAKVLAQSVHDDFDMIAAKIKNKDKGR